MPFATYELGGVGCVFCRRGDGTPTHRRRTICLRLAGRYCGVAFADEPAEQALIQHFRHRRRRRQRAAEALILANGRLADANARLCERLDEFVRRGGDAQQARQRLGGVDALDVADVEAGALAEAHLADENASDHHVEQQRFVGGREAERGESALQKKRSE